MEKLLNKIKAYLASCIWRKIPTDLRFSADCLKILNRRFGYRRSVKSGLPLDAENNPLPWYTYPAIEYLTQFDYHDKKIFEWGGGYSSLFWSQRAEKVISIDDNAEWAEKIGRESKKDNLKIKNIQDKTEYIEAIKEHDEKYDVIIIDGKFRFNCAEICNIYLEEGGLVILDNSDWFPKTAGLLKNRGFFQVDFSGFGPCNNYTWTTSLFFRKGFGFKTLNADQPVHSMGSIRQYAE